MPFAKYDGVLDLISQCGATVNRRKSLQENSYLWSELLRAEMIDVIGEH